MIMRRLAVLVYVVVAVSVAQPALAAPEGFLNGQGPRVQESGLGLIAGHAYSAPYEDVRLKK